MRGYFIIVIIAITISISTYLSNKETVINNTKEEELHYKERHIKNEKSVVYNAKDAKQLIPVKGYVLKIIPKILRKLPLAGSTIIRLLKINNGVIDVRMLASKLVTNYLPLFYPRKVPTKRLLDNENDKANLFDLNTFVTTQRSSTSTSDKEEDSFKYWSIKDYRNKYLSGELTPLQVARILIKSIKESNTDKYKLNAIITLNERNILYEAELSTLRYVQNKTKGMLDGIPITIKDSINVKNYITAHGTSFIKDNIFDDVDDYSIERLRSYGVLIIGKCNLHEIGLGTTGHNTYYGPTRNPYNLKYYTGGSSSGSSASVSSGLVPLSVGTDGGGSICIPSSLCGVVGLKPTFGRIDMKNYQGPTITHIGPIGATVEDVAIGYVIMAGDDSSADEETTIKPKVHISSFDEIDDLSDVRIGIFKDHINDSKHNKTINATYKAIEYYKSKGATIIEISIPYMQEINLAHLITITSEVVQFHDSIYDDEGEQFSYETQIVTELGRSFTSIDYIAAQRVRSYAMEYIYDNVFTKVDVILSPGTATPAPMIPPDVIETGEMNLIQTTDLMKYAILGNFIGIPAIVFPIDYDNDNDGGSLPIALQLQGRHWEEDTLLRLAHAGEGILNYDGKKRKKPDYFVDVIKEASKL